MRFVYLFLLTILLVTYWSVLAKVLKRSRGLTPILGWMIGQGFFVLAPLTLLTLNGGYVLPEKWNVGNEWGAVDLKNASLFFPYTAVWASLMSTCLVTYIFLPALGKKSVDSDFFSRPALQRTILVTMALTVANWLLIVRFVGGFDAFLTSHWYLRNEALAERYGDLFVLQEHLELANQILFTSGASLHTSLGLRNRDTDWKFTALILLFFLIELLLSGNRIFFALYLLALVISCWLHRRRRILIAALALSPMIAQIFGMWASLRHDLTAIQDSYDAYVEQNVGNPYATTLMDATEGTNVMLLLHIIQDFGTRHDYYYGSTYSRTITSLIPRRTYPQKPENFTVLLARVYLPNEVTSLNATALGEMYANFGPFGLLLFPMFTLGVVAISGWAVRKEQNHGLTSTVLFMSLMLVARSTFADSCTELVLIILMIKVFRLEHGLCRQGLSPRQRFLCRNESVPVV